MSERFKTRLIEPCPALIYTDKCDGLAERTKSEQKAVAENIGLFAPLLLTEGGSKIRLARIGVLT